MSASRPIDDHIPYSNLEGLIACQNPHIEQAILSKLEADARVKPFIPLESILAMYGRADALQELWKRCTANLKDHFDPISGFYFAKRFNRPELVKAYLDFFQRNNRNYVLRDNKTPASLHKAAYLSKEPKKPTEKDMVLESLKALKKKASGKDTHDETQIDLLTAICNFDQFEELPLHNAIAGGNKQLAEFLLDETPPKLYDLPELIIRILESRNTRLAPAFINRLAERRETEGRSLFKRYDCTERFIVKLLKTAATCYEKSPGHTITTLLMGITAPEIREKWIRLCRDTALLEGSSDIFIALIRECSIQSEPVYEQLFNLFLMSENFPSQKINLSRLVVTAFMPFIEKSPALIQNTVDGFLTALDLDGEDQDEDGTDYIITTKHFLSYLPEKIKKIAFKSNNHPLIKKCLANPTVDIFESDLKATYQLFEIAKNKRPLNELTTILNLYIDYFDKKEGSAVTLFCAAHVAFLLKKYNLARSWYERCLDKISTSNDGIILTASRLVTRQILVLFEDLRIELPDHYIDTYKNNLFSLINDDSFSFSLVTNSLLFASSIRKNRLSFKKVYDHVCEIEDGLSHFKNHDQNEAWHLLYEIKQSSLLMYQLFSSLTLNYVKTAEVKPEPTSISEAKETLAIIQLTRNNFIFINELITRLGASPIISDELIELDDNLVMLSALISTASEKLAMLEDEKKNKRIEAEKKHQINLAIKKAGGSRKKKGSHEHKIEEQHPTTDTSTTNTPISVQKTDKKSPHHISKEKLTVDNETLALELKLKRLAEERKLEKEIEDAIKAEEEAMAEESRRSAREKQEKEAEIIAANAISSPVEIQERKSINQQIIEPAESPIQAPIAPSNLAQGTPAPALAQNQSQATPLTQPQPTYHPHLPWMRFLAMPYRVENPIYTHTRELNLPQVVGMLFEKYENRISLTGGAVRDTYLKSRTPSDYDFVLFGTEDEVMRDFPAATMHKGKHTVSFNLIINETKIDIKLLPPARNHEEKIELLKAEASTRDFTINALHRVITRDSSILLDFFNGTAHLNQRILAMPNENDAIGTFLLYPDRFFRLLYLNSFLQFRLSAGVTDNIRKIHESPDAFILQCKKSQSAIRRQINKMIEHYGRHMTYLILHHHHLPQILTYSGVLSAEQISELENAYAKHKMGFFTAQPDENNTPLMPTASPKL